MKKSILASAFVLLAAASTHAAVIISEVHPTGSSTSTYAADWFELTNTGASAVDITGWKMDDNSHNIAVAVAFRGVTSIAAGQSVVFFEGKSDNSSDAAITASFISAWFGGTAPAGFTIGAYGGSGVGLGSGGDEVNIYDGAGNLVAGVSFGASTTGTTFDNAAGATGTISTLSVAGINGAFLSPTGETGSPGAISAAVPEPTSLALLAAGLPLIARRRRA